MSHVVDAKGRDLRSVSKELREALTSGPVTVKHAAHLHGLIAGLKSGEVTIDGDAGDYLGAVNDGVSIRVTGKAGRYLADNMTKGTVIVEGSAGYGVGAYCYGGTVVVRGDAGDFSAVMNKGAVILVQGSVGNEVATYMLAGDLLICGGAGEGLGNYLIRGNIFVRGAFKSLGHNTQVVDKTPADVARIRGYLEKYGIGADPSGFTKIVRLSEKPFYK